LNTGLFYALYSTYFLDANTGYAVGAGSTIIKTINGGATWTTLNSGIQEWLNSVFFTDANTGYAGGYLNNSWAIIKTTDGGQNWITQKTGQGNNFGNIYFTDANNGYAMDGWPYKTTNAGVTWTNMQTMGGNALFFTDVNTGYIVSSSGYISKTTNGGTDWAQQTSGTTKDLYSVFFPTSNIGYIVGDSGIILKTMNGGNTWKIQTAPTSEWLGSVYFTDANTGYISGVNGTILKTSNGGDGINELSDRSHTLNIYPNPATDKATIEISGTPIQRQLSITNLNGQQILTSQINALKTQIDISKLPSGVYFVRTTNDKTVEVGKIIKE
jgi:photosystem II stability/assembly factor-like uncharacterized protein